MEGTGSSSHGAFPSSQTPAAAPAWPSSFSEGSLSAQAPHRTTMAQPPLMVIPGQPPMMYSWQPPTTMYHNNLHHTMTTPGSQSTPSYPQFAHASATSFMSPAVKTPQKPLSFKQQQQQEQDHEQLQQQQQQQHSQPISQQLQQEQHSPQIRWSPPQKMRRASSKKKQTKRRRSDGPSRARKAASANKSLPPVTLRDEDASRLVNPLLEVPFFPLGSADPPTASELYVWTNLAFARPDTFPLSYYARLLGFRVPPPPPPLPSKIAQHIPMNVSTLPLGTYDDDDVWKQIPPLGSFFAASSSRKSTLDFVDPMYKALCDKGIPEDWNPNTSRPTELQQQQVLHPNCLQMARKQGLLEPLSTPQFSISDGDNNHCCLQLGNSKIKYCFAWYLLQQDDDHEKAEQERQKGMATYGIPSAAAFLRKPQVSELMVYIKEIEGGAVESELIVLMAFVLEHARSNNIWYGFLQAPLHLSSIFTKCFRMTRLSTDRLDVVPMVCDLHKCSYKYAFWYKESRPQSAPCTKQRWLVRLPNVDEAKAALHGIGQEITNSRKPRYNYGGANERMRSIAFGVRCSLTTFTYELLDEWGEPKGPLPVSSFARQPQWEILKSFPLVVPTEEPRDDEDEILSELLRKQEELTTAERTMEPKLRSLMQQMVDLRMEYELDFDKREKDRKTLGDYEAILERRKEMDLAWQKQLEQDMDAVCDICHDGEVTPDNQILFCEACNVAVHQMCYGIDEVPEGDYYCIACRYFNREKMNQTVARQVERGSVVTKLAPTALPIFCELCPRKQGAFIRTDTSRQKPPRNSDKVVVSKWVHVVCAKWQGLNFVPNDKKDTIEDVTELKWSFLRLKYQCILCLGSRGAYNQCRHAGCNSWMHVTCARATGLCEVIHGENCNGAVESNPWTLLCPEHSDVDPESVSESRRVALDQLVRAALEFPQEPMPDPPKPKPNKPFNKMPGNERRQFLGDPEYEMELLKELLKKLQGVYCEVCNQCEEDGKNLTRCYSCEAVFCDSCKLDSDMIGEARVYKCAACVYVGEKRIMGERIEQPSCHMCFQRGGFLRRGFAEPVNKKGFWKNNVKEFERSYFSKILWCHMICTLWQPSYLALAPNGTVDCSSIIMSNGREHILGSNKCALCGHKRRMKAKCSEPGCRGWGEKKTPYFFHITCARQAGFELNDITDTNETLFDVKCFRHSGNASAFRAKLEDLIEVEKRRCGKRLERLDAPMSLAHASKLLNKAIVVMKILGWAWRWAEWWVEHGDHWEPFLEEGEVEAEMTKEQLRIVDSTRESRCDDARKCRLAPLGAALRNRNYDEEEGDDAMALDRGLRAMLHAKSLVGPLDQIEIDFFADWLARAYRSKSRLLGFGSDKISVKEVGGSVHVDDKTPKYMLGTRRLPGKQELPEGVVFEVDVNEVDDFLKPETFDDGTVVTPATLKLPRKKRDDWDIPVSVLKESMVNKKHGRRATNITPGASLLSRTDAQETMRALGRSSVNEGGRSTTEFRTAGDVASPLKSPGKRRGRPPGSSKAHGAVGTPSKLPAATLGQPALSRPLEADAQSRPPRKKRKPARIETLEQPAILETPLTASPLKKRIRLQKSLASADATRTTLDRKRIKKPKDPLNSGGPHHARVDRHDIVEIPGTPDDSDSSKNRISTADDEDHVPLSVLRAQATTGLPGDVKVEGASGGKVDLMTSRIPRKRNPGVDDSAQHNSDAGVE